MLLPLLLKGLLAALIVGFVTASIQSWVDRFFLVIMLIGIVGLPIQEAVTINLMVVSLAALMMVLRQTDVLTSVRQDWGLVILPAIIGAVLGRVLGVSVSPKVLTILLAVYAILAGLRLAFIRPLPEKETQAHPAWLVPIAFGASLLTGLLSAGAKVFQVPLINLALGRHPKQAYALAALSVSVAAPVALATQIGLGAAPTVNQILLALYLFVLIVGVALTVKRFWTPKLNQVVTWIISPILVLVGIRFLLMVLR
ncbi:MAG: sulfite exporter TauE/SafE family protein [Anaerolineales bacterium]